MGFLESYRAYLDSATWLPDNFKVASGVMTLSVLTRGKVYCEYSVSRYYPNLYTMLVGDSGSGKGVAIEKTAKCFIDRVNPILDLGQRFTPEGFYMKLSEMDRAEGIVLNDELNTICNAKKYMVGFTTNLIELYNRTGDPFYSIRYAKQEFEINNPFVSVFTGIQPASLGKVLSSGDITSGFAPRWWIVVGHTMPRRRVVVDHGAFEVALNMASKINILFEHMTAPVRLDVDYDAADLIDDYSCAVKDENQEDVFARLGDIIYKLSLIHAINRITEQCICTKSVYCFRCPDYKDCFGHLLDEHREVSMERTRSSSFTNYNTVLYVPGERVRVLGVDTLTQLNAPDGQENSVNSVRSVNEASEPSDVSDVSEENVYKGDKNKDLQNQVQLLIEGLNSDSVNLLDVGAAIDMISIEDMINVSNRISTDIDTATLQRYREYIARIVKSNVAITMVDGKIMVPQRELMRSVGTTAMRMKPYIETLVIEGYISALMAYHGKGRTMNVYEYTAEKNKQV